jgi:hypothetical protein
MLSSSWSRNLEILGVESEDTYILPTIKMSHYKRDLKNRLAVDELHHYTLLERDSYKKSFVATKIGVLYNSTFV